MDRHLSYGLPDTAIQSLNKIFREDNRIENVWLYGSRATGKQRQASDIDLCIEGQKLSLTDLHALECKIDDLLLPWKVDLSLKHQIDNSALLKHITDVGINFLD
jgi:predicted nucleotidyltransferase